LKRFYKTAEAGTAPGGYVIRLDGKAVKTPLQNNLLLESKFLAEAMAIEWNNQGKEIDINSMPLNQFANTMVDKSKGSDREDMNKELLRYASSDLICYFATTPKILVERHKENWLPLIDWLKDEYDIALEYVSGIKYHNQPKESLNIFEKLIEGLNPRDFTIVQFVTGVTGSVVIALAMLHEKISTNKAYEAACVDEIYQLETWGEDDEARKHLDGKKLELENIKNFIELSAV